MTAHELSRDLREWVPKELRSLANPQTAIPAIAQDARLMSLIDNAVRSIPTTHRLFLRDARLFGDLSPNSVHLVVRKLPMLDERALPKGAQSAAVGTVIIALVRRQRLELF